MLNPWTIISRPHCICNNKVMFRHSKIHLRDQKYHELNLPLVVVANQVNCIDGNWVGYYIYLAKTKMAHQPFIQTLNVSLISFVIPIWPGLAPLNSESCCDINLYNPKWHLKHNFWFGYSLPSNHYALFNSKMYQINQ